MADLVIWMDQSARERTRRLELVQVWRSPESLDCLLKGRITKTKHTSGKFLGVLGIDFKI